MKHTLLFSFLCPAVLCAEVITASCTEVGATVMVTKTIGSTKVVTRSPIANVQKKKSTVTSKPILTILDNCDEISTSLARRATGDGGYSLPQYRTRLADPYELLHSSLSSASASAVQARQFHTDVLKARTASSPMASETILDPNSFTYTKYNLPYTSNVVEVAIAQATGNVIAASNIKAQMTARAELNRRGGQKYSLPYTSLPATVLAEIEAAAKVQKRDGFIGTVVKQNEDGTLTLRDGQLAKRNGFIGRIVKQEEDGSLVARSNDLERRDGFIGKVVKQNEDGSLTTRGEEVDKRDEFLGNVVKQDVNGRIILGKARVGKRDGFIGKVVEQDVNGKLMRRSNVEKPQGLGFIGVKVKQDVSGVLSTRDVDRGVQENNSLVTTKKWWALQ